MAVNPTGDIFKTLTFGGRSSAEFGVYITGSGVFNAPARDVEMVTIPGRNGAFVLDNGRFENVEVTYPAGIFGKTEAEFAEAVSAFRNYLCSRQGYIRLEDDYNPNEYRMAVYKSGLEVDPAKLKAGQFNIVFDCKPQRWLKSGETAIITGPMGYLEIANNGYFASSPLLRAYGYGEIGINDKTVKLTNATFGDVTISSSFSVPISGGTRSLNLSNMASGDTFTVKGLSGMWYVGSVAGQGLYSWENVAMVNVRSTGVEDVSEGSNTGLEFTYTADDIDFTVGQIKVKQISVAGDLSLKYSSGGHSAAYRLKLSLAITYDGDSTLAFSASQILVDGHDPEGVFYIDESLSNPYYCSQITGASTKSRLGDPTYIDCESGMAYLIDGSEIALLDKYVDLGSELPVLSPGINVITTPRTITRLEVVPRWWKI